MNRNIFIFGTAICSLVLLFATCIQVPDAGADPRGQAYAGAATCTGCHKNIAGSYAHTAHAFTTNLASLATVHGSFSKDSNAYQLNAATKIIMEQRDSGLYQVNYTNGRQQAARRFDIVLGGVKGESYLYWKGNQLFQLPISYSNTLHNWTNSPGYMADDVNFNRLIPRRCFECHSAYIKELPPQAGDVKLPESLDRKSLIYTIDCERCHGPGARHVSYETAHPGEGKDSFMVPIHTLSRQQKVDLCGVCHSGNKHIMLRTTFGFKPGDALADYILPEFSAYSTDAVNIDVHGNQQQLLAKSKCFIMSNLDCTTCHNPHQDQKNKVAVYNTRCTNCHTAVQHSFNKNTNGTSAAFINNNCITCHMPPQPSAAIVVHTSGNGKAIPVQVVNHHIAIYPSETEKVLAYLKNDPAKE